MAMTVQEAIAILQTPLHPERGDTVAVVSEFLTRGITGICFGIQLDRVPGPQRGAKVVQALHGLAEGECCSVEAVVSFLSQDSMPLSFHFFLQDTGRGDATPE